MPENQYFEFMMQPKTPFPRNLPLNETLSPKKKSAPEKKMSLVHEDYRLHEMD